jgi:hypothetical protein
MPEKAVPLLHESSSRAVNFASIAQALVVAERLSFRQAAGVLGSGQSNGAQGRKRTTDSAIWG